ncbi:uncharacterized protein N7459_005562 [Penicillium hispanicum]|uniref:uncharacterized protein n=1 Tax=Penicillium hispanicum TaxID=1080232 RepID=UPI00254149CC|nr:uncharacterized protein N7459_005562 [Penicillium hispanicum]KAJ5579577.1 hypothetical protein N7459_005562 [Penicillium hispanicum]
MALEERSSAQEKVVHPVGESNTAAPALGRVRRVRSEGVRCQKLHLPYTDDRDYVQEFYAPSLRSYLASFARGVLAEPLGLIPNIAQGPLSTVDLRFRFIAANGRRLTSGIQDGLSFMDI